MGSMLFLGVRVVHVLLAAAWVGASVFTSYLLMPAVADAGPAGGQVMVSLNRKGIVPFFASVGGITALTGIYLYWRFTGGFDPAISRTNGGMAFGIGGLAGILATIVGGAVVGRSSKKMVEVMEQAMKLPDNAEKRALMQEAAVLRQRLSTFGTLVIVLQVVALAFMAVGHYI